MNSAVELLRHIAAGRIGGQEYTLCGIRVTWTFDEFNSLPLDRVCADCQALDC